MTIILKLNKVYGEVFNYVIGIVQLVAYIDLMMDAMCMPR